MTAKPGDWIIRGVKGEFYPCKPDIFAATYEPAALHSALPDGGVGENLKGLVYGDYDRVRPAAGYRMPRETVELLIKWAGSDMHMPNELLRPIKDALAAAPQSQDAAPRMGGVEG